MPILTTAESIRYAALRRHVVWALLLALLGGWAGAHFLYLREYRRAALQLVVTLTALMAALGLGTSAPLGIPLLAAAASLPTLGALVDSENLRVRSALAAR